VAQFSVNAGRFDPYKDFKFRVLWSGRVVAGVSRVSALIRTTEVIEHRDGGDPSTTRRSPGQTAFEPVTLERGVTHDLEFERWANRVFRLGASAGQEMSLGDFREDVVLELRNEAGQTVLAYRLYRCWVSEYQALPDLDANGASVAIERLVLQNEGWERDTSVTEPAEPIIVDLPGDAPPSDDPPDDDPPGDDPPDDPPGDDPPDDDPLDDDPPGDDPPAPPEAPPVFTPPIIAQPVPRPPRGREA
jgi:phage tail-like protein